MSRFNHVDEFQKFNNPKSCTYYTRKFSRAEDARFDFFFPRKSLSFYPSNNLDNLPLSLSILSTPNRDNGILSQLFISLKSEFCRYSSRLKKVRKKEKRNRNFRNYLIFRGFPEIVTRF